MIKQVDVKIIPIHEDAQIPEYKTDGSSGFDIRVISNMIIAPGETYICKTGLTFEIPKGYEIEIRPRSGISAKTKLRISNSPGTIDSDYRGEVGIIIDNIGDEPITIKKGDRVAQGVIKEVIQANFIKVDELSKTKRGEGGYGSTGVK